MVNIDKIYFNGVCKRCDKGSSSKLYFQQMNVSVRTQCMRLLMLFWRLSSSLAFPFVNLNCYVCDGIAARLNISFYIIIFRLSSIHPFEVITIKKITLRRTKFVNKLIEQHKWKQMTLFLYFKRIKERDSFVENV